MPIESSSVLIVGGGLAGLAAATALGKRGFRVTLCESRPRLGGRASSFVDHETGETIDNCQHVGMGCCTNLLQFAREHGFEQQLRSEPFLTFVGPQGSRTKFAASSLPAPLHLAVAFLKLPYLTLREKRLLARAIRTLSITPPNKLAGVRFSDWLRDQNQTPALISRVWEVILVSALSETLDRIDAAHARKVIVDGFLTHREGWRMLVPVVPLDDLYTQFILPSLRASNVGVRLLTGVDRLEAQGERVDSAVLKTGERIECDDYVVAVPHYRVGELLPHGEAADSIRTSLQNIESAPITSVHLWYDRPITDLPHAVIVGKLSQWLFAKPPSGHEASASARPKSDHDASASAERFSNTLLHGYQVVISASREAKAMTKEQLIDAVVGEIAALFPPAMRDSLRHTRVVTEHRAVFSVTPGIEQYRWPQQSPWSNLQLAGDWTRTGWPATMEGAIRSGYRAAENILARYGRTEKLVQPGLPMAWLARLSGVQSTE